jgi:hypothetical protein
MNKHVISPRVRRSSAFNVLGSPFTGWFQFQILYSKIVREPPDLLN